MFGKQNNKQRKIKVYQIKWNDKSWKNSDQDFLSPHQIMKGHNMDLVKTEEKLELERMQLGHKITMLLGTDCFRMFLRPRISQAAKKNQVSQEFLELWKLVLQSFGKEIYASGFNPNFKYHEEEEKCKD